LVTKPHNKTPYELLHGRLPSIGFMRPFGCLVAILNTPDPLDKFQKKVDEGFLVGYSVCSKAFRAFNSRTRIVQETLHTMNYHPVLAENQSNPTAGFQVTEKAGRKELKHICGDQAREQGDKAMNKDKECINNSSNEVSVAGPSVFADGLDFTNSTNDFTAAEADTNNMESIISVSPIPTTRIHKDHPTSQIIGDLSSTTQTRSMAREVRDQGGIS
nr:retrovirus-related Pol polyprotein from transposon TNT 1-94 [Tanacetum cinerariifolium]